MKKEVRIYKRFDTDLLALHHAGYSVARMMRDAVISYAKGIPFYITIDEINDFKLDNKSSTRLMLTFKDNDKDVINLFKNVKRGYASNFCKQVLRSAFISQNLACYFLNPKTSIRIDMDKNITEHIKVIKCSVYKESKRGVINLFDISQPKEIRTKKKEEQSQKSITVKGNTQEKQENTIEKTKKMADTYEHPKVLKESKVEQYNNEEEAPTVTEPSNEETETMEQTSDDELMQMFDNLGGM